MTVSVCRWAKAPECANARADTAYPPCHARGRHGARCAFAPPYGTGRSGTALHDHEERRLRLARSSPSSPMTAVTGSRLDAALNQKALGAVVPDIHLDDLSVLDDEPIDIAVAVERGAVEPLAVERADAVHDGLVGAWAYIEAIHLLLDPAVAPRVETGRPARMIELAAPGEGDHRAWLHEHRRRIRVGNHRGGKIGFDGLGIRQKRDFGFCDHGHGGASPHARPSYNSASILHATFLDKLDALCTQSGVAQRMEASANATAACHAMSARTAFDQVFRNAVTRASPTPLDIGVSGGRIAAIAPHLACDAAEIDLGGRLVLPGFVDSHIHLDKACLLGRCGHVQGSLKDAIAAVGAMKRDFTVEDVY